MQSFSLEELDKDFTFYMGIFYVRVSKKILQILYNN